MRTRRNRLWVSLASALLVVGACGGQHPATRAEPAESVPADVLQFDNQATMYADVYLVRGQLQWRLGRVPPGFREMLRIPEPAMSETQGLVQLTVIPGSQVSAESWRDPRAIIGVAQSISEVLSQRWSFRQGTGAVLQLQATRLR